MRSAWQRQSFGHTSWQASSDMQPKTPVVVADQS
jgi:hypothetical protein